MFFLTLWLLPLQIQLNGSSSQIPIHRPIQHDNDYSRKLNAQSRNEKKKVEIVVEGDQFLAEEEVQNREGNSEKKHSGFYVKEGFVLRNVGKMRENQVQGHREDQNQVDDVVVRVFVDFWGRVEEEEEESYRHRELEQKEQKVEDALQVEVTEARDEGHWFY